VPEDDAGRVNPSSLAPGTLLASRYRIERELGRGAMGAVYVVTHVNTGATLALKVMLNSAFLEQDRAERFRREARASSLVRSDHVVRVTDADTAPELGGAPFLVMDLLEGENLEERIQRGGPLPPDETVAVLRDVARALDRAHEAGVVHRDLKPENVFLERRDDGSSMVKLLDFGISKILRDDSLASSTGGLILGTPLYMAPEQVRTGTPVGPGTDIWAIGLLAVEMLTGQSYWQAETAFDLLMAIVAPERRPPSERWPQLGASFDAWFLRSCAAVPEQRWPRAGQQVKALAEALLIDRTRLLPRSLPSLGDLSDSTVDEEGATAAWDALSASAAVSVLEAQPLRQSASGGVVVVPHARAVSVADAEVAPDAARQAQRARRRLVFAGFAVLVPALVALFAVRAWQTAGAMPATVAHPAPESVVAAPLRDAPSLASAEVPAAPLAVPVETAAPAPTPILAPSPPSLPSPTPAPRPVHGRPGADRLTDKPADHAVLAPPPASASPPPPRDLFDTPN
jgi:serine/threonine protein kinase